MTTLSSPGDAARAADAKFEVKASVLQGLVDQLREDGRLAEVLAAVSPTTATVSRNPAVHPWTPGRVSLELYDVIHDLFGVPYLRKVSRDAALQGAVPLARPTLERILRIFGASPATLLARTDLLIKPFIRGHEIAYRALGARRGALTVGYPTSRNIPMSAFLATLGTVDLFFQLTSTPPGTAEGPVLVPNGMHNSATIAVAW